MRQKIIIIWAIILLSMDAVAQDTLWQDANMAYDSGNYNGAISLYEQLLEAGYDYGGLVYFNVGLAYYETGDIGQSLVYLKRAERFMPRDAALRQILAQTRSERVDLLGDERNFLDNTAMLTRVLAWPELLIVLLVFWSGLLVTLSLYVLMPKQRVVLRTMLIVFGGLLSAVVLLSAVRWYVDTNRPEAVVVVDDVDVYSGPDAAYVVMYDLSEAAELRVVSHQADWVKINLPDGRQGWVSASAIQYVR